MVDRMVGENPPTKRLKDRQEEEERTEREQLDEAITPAEADLHRRRAEQADYLRRKLEQRERSEDASRDDGDE